MVIFIAYVMISQFLKHKHTKCGIALMPFIFYVCVRLSINSQSLSSVISLVVSLIIIITNAIFLFSKIRENFGEISVESIRNMFSLPNGIRLFSIASVLLVLYAGLLAVESTQNEFYSAEIYTRNVLPLTFSLQYPYTDLNYALTIVEFFDYEFSYWVPDSFEALSWK